MASNGDEDLLLTARHRQARVLRERDDRARVAAGETVWEPRSIYSFDRWLLDVWESTWPAAQLLTRLQELFIWESIIAGDGALASNLPPRELAPLARTAHRRIIGHALADPPSRESGAGARFPHWRERYLATLREKRWIDAAQAMQEALRLIVEGAASIPARVRLLGFERHAPFLDLLTGALAKRGVAVAGAASGEIARARQPVARLARPHDDEEEARWAARWARERLLANPRAEIGVIVPELAARARSLEIAFEEELMPAASVEHPARRGAAAFSIHHAPSLAGYPVIRLALDLCAAVPSDLHTDLFLRLLASPFVAGGELERSARARFAAELCESGRVRFPLAWILEQLGSAGIPELRRILAEWSSAASSAGSDQPTPALTPDKWVAHFRAALAALWWPGERALNSNEFQCVQRWHELLDELSGLTALKPAIGVSWTQTEAAARLREAAERLPFAPAQGAASVQLLTPADALDLPFDHLWFLGGEESVWPPHTYPDPLLPVGWERSGSDNDGRALAARLCAAAPECVVSARRFRKEEEILPSPLFAELPEFVPSAASARRWDLLANAWRPENFEAFMDDKGPALTGDTRQPGGARLFADQAACPFRAFAHHRLNATSPELPAELIDPRARGELLHFALQEFWRGCVDQRTLQALAPAQLDERVRSVVRAAAARHLDARTDLPPLHRRLEEERARALLLAWLAIEGDGTKRDFFKVEQTERRHTVTRGGIEIDIIVDRVDRIADGQVVILDYKTGRGEGTSKWDDVRLDEPQLPLYATVHMQKVGAIAFARLRWDKIGFSGVSCTDRILPSVRSYSRREEGSPVDWEQLVKFWFMSISALGEEFAGGVARVDPKVRAKTCTNCDLHSLCRIDERAHAAHAEESGDDGRSDGAEEEEE